MEITEIKRGGKGGRRPGAGRPKGGRDRATGEQRASFQDLAREYTELALATLARVAKGSDAAAVSAANSLLDRGYGRPAQAVHLSGADGGPVRHEDVSPARDELISRINGVAARTGQTEGASKPH